MFGELKMFYTSLQNDKNEKIEKFGTVGTKILHLADRNYSTKKCCMVMGILNANSSSFYEKSRVPSTDEAVEKALKMIEDGADILDIGSESSQPGIDYIDEQTELEKVVPIVQKIRKYNQTIPISIDTRKKNVIEQCVQSGVDILNDISALEDDEKMGSYVASSKISVILMHKRGNPKQMQQNTQYDDVVKEVSNYLYERADYAIEQGISEEKIIFDVGIGFGKDLKSNLQLVRNCDKISKGYKSGNCLSIMALSRKTMIQVLTGKNVQDCLAGTIAANSFAILSGADIVRVHDVKEAVDMVNVLSALLGVSA